MKAERFCARESLPAQVADLIQRARIQLLRVNAVDVKVEIGAMHELLFAVAAREFETGVYRSVVFRPVLQSAKLFVAFLAFVQASRRTVDFLFVDV